MCFYFRFEQISKGARGVIGFMVQRLKEVKVTVVRPKPTMESDDSAFWKRLVLGGTTLLEELFNVTQHLNQIGP